MRTLRLSLIGTVILMLVGGLTVAVAAQSGESARATQVSGTVVDEEHVVSATCADVDGVEKCRDGRVEYVFEWSDARLPSAGWQLVNHNVYDVPDAGAGYLMNALVGLEGPDGWWAGEAIGSWLPDEDSVVLWTLDGAGAYDGMTAVLGAGGGTMSGLIIEGEMPPTPEGVTLLVGEEYSGSPSDSADDSDSQVACVDVSQPQNKAADMPVVVKDTISGWDIHAPEFLTDGKYGNSCSWVAESGNNWIEVDLGEPRTFRLVRFGRDRLEGGYDDRDPGRFTIEIADEPDEYRRIFDSADTDFDGDISGGESIVVSFAGGVKAQYVKLNLTKHGAAVDEIELLESPDFEWPEASDQ